MWTNTQVRKGYTKSLCKAEGNVSNVLMTVTHLNVQTYEHIYTYVAHIKTLTRYD